MPTITTDDGVRLHYEEAGSGTPLVFVHEFAGDARAWEPQLRFFARRYRCIAINARGYPPSAVPAEAAAYSQDRATDDIAAVIQQLGSGAGACGGAVDGRLRHPASRPALPASGPQPDRGRRRLWRPARQAGPVPRRGGPDRRPDRRRGDGPDSAGTYGRGPTRLVFEEKDPRGYAEFLAQLAEHDTDGAVRTMRGVQRERPSLFDLEAQFRRLTLPTLIICGDEDDPTLEPGLFLKRSIATSALLVLPRCGHTMNLEDPEAFNRGLLDFMTWVDAGRWWERNPETLAGGIIAGTARD